MVGEGVNFEKVHLKDLIGGGDVAVERRAAVLIEGAVMDDSTVEEWLGFGKNEEWRSGAVIDDNVEELLILGTNGEWRSGAAMDDIIEEWL